MNGFIQKLLQVFLTTLLFCSFTFSEELKLTHITYSSGSGYGELYLNLDSKKDIQFMTWHFTNSEGEREKGNFTIEELNRGQIFKGGFISKFIKARGDNFSAHNGGNLEIEFPSNIVTGTKLTMDFLIDRVGNKWTLVHVDKEKVSKIHIIMRRVLGAPVGAKEVQLY